MTWWEKVEENWNGVLKRWKRRQNFVSKFVSEIEIISYKFENLFLMKF
jgi:hypothetical protein